MTNFVCLIGNVGADPITRGTSTGKNVTTVSLATSQRWTDKNTGEIKEQTEWHRVTCFNGLGTNVAKYVRKGSKISVQGRIHYSSYTDQDGTKRYAVEILADTVDFLTPAPKAGDTPTTAARTDTRKPAMAGAVDDLDDDSVPF